MLVLLLQTILAIKKTIPINGNKNIMAISNTSPANILPKSLNVKLTTLANSAINSNIQTNSIIGEEKLINFAPYFSSPIMQKN